MPTAFVIRERVPSFRFDLLGASAPAYPQNRAFGDVDKLARALLDALTGVLIADDAQVVDLRVRKAYADDDPAAHKPKTATP